MSNRNLAILGVLAAVLLVLAVVQSKMASTGPKVDQNVITYLIQGFDPATISSMEIGTAANPVKFARTENGFAVVNKDNYPAKTDGINDMIQKVLDIKTVELITNKQQNHADLGVTEQAATNIFKFLDNNGKVITGVMIGKTARPRGSYVRRITDDIVYLAENTPWIRTNPMDYIDTQIFELKHEDIASVTITDANSSFTLKPEPNGPEVVLENMPADKKLKNEARDVFNTLMVLQFSDVMSLAKAPKDLAFDHTYVCRLKNSTVYTLNIAKSSGRTFIKCRAEFTDRKLITAGSGMESQEELKQKESVLLARDAVKKFNALRNPWVYEITDYKAGYLTMQRSGLLEEIKKPESTTGTPAEPNVAQSQPNPTQK